ncbi:type II secretion system protein [Candidatus Saganbacteria bacterium]|nr:type II secretion system protein [Candidatus Saganbacteria bacterium]
MRRGFTLIEVLVALMILASIGGTFLFFFKTGLNAQADSDEFFAALNAGRMELEELRATPWSELRASPHISLVPVAYDLYQVRYTYNWHPGRKPIEIVTLRSKY